MVARSSRARGANRFNSVVTLEVRALAVNQRGAKALRRFDPYQRSQVSSSNRFSTPRSYNGLLSLTVYQGIGVRSSYGAPLVFKMYVILDALGVAVT